MAKTKIEFVCRECGSSHHQWAGQCLDCKEWNTLEEVVISQATSSKPESLKDLPASKVQNLSEIKSQNKIISVFDQNNKQLNHNLLIGQDVLCSWLEDSIVILED